MGKKKPGMHDYILSYIKQYLTARCEDSLRDVLLDDIPRKWERHGDLILFPESSFKHTFWHEQDKAFWEGLATVLKVRRLGLMGRTSSNGFREPNTKLMLGDSGWTEHVDNGIKYCFDATKTMFSSGNITEKIRVANFDCTGETVVDMYAGIGYYTLPYLVHTNAAHVHACEWNPNAVAALKRGLERNKVESRCTVHPGDNTKAGLVNVANRVNLGLLPTSRPGWETACRALKPSGGILHIHDCLNSKHSGFEDSKEEYCKDTCHAINEILSQVKPECDWNINVIHFERVKSYAPHIDHVVMDCACSPTSHS